MRSAQEARNPDDLRGLIRLAGASEMIFDSAREMTRLVEAGLEVSEVRPGERSLEEVFMDLTGTEAGL